MLSSIVNYQTVLLSPRSSTTSLCLNEPRSNDNIRVFPILQYSSPGTLTSDVIQLYQGHSFGVFFYPLCRDAVSTLNSPRRLGLYIEKGIATEKQLYIYIYIYIYIYYIYIYIYCHKQTDCFVVSKLFSEARYVWRLKLGSKPAQLYVRLSIVPLSPQANHISSRIIRPDVVAFVCLHFCSTGHKSAQFVRRALHYASGSCKFLRQSFQPPWRSVYIYICTMVGWKVHIRTNLLLVRGE